MSRSFVAASQQYLRYAGAILTAEPFTISAWVDPATGAPNSAGFFEIINSVTEVDYYRGIIVETSMVARVAQRQTASSVVNLDTANAATAGVFNHVVFGNDVSLNSFIRLNGGTKATGTGKQPITMNQTTVGATPSTGAYFETRVAEVAGWSTNLDDDEQLALSKGISPLLIRPQSLVAYWPLFGISSPEPDYWKNRYDFTLTGSPTKSDQPRLYLPS